MMSGPMQGERGRFDMGKTVRLLKYKKTQQRMKEGGSQSSCKKKP